MGRAVNFYYHLISLSVVVATIIVLITTYY